MTFTLLILSSLLAHAAPTLSISGSCPGSATVLVAGLTEGGAFAILKGSGTGSTPIPAGACEGTLTGLADVALITRRTDSDGDGMQNFFPSLPTAVCSETLQILDLETCSLSDPFDMLGLVSTSGGITTTGGTVYDIAYGVTDTFGDIDLRCAEWTGAVCTDFRTRVPSETCETLFSSDDWHRHLYVNTPEDRSCPLICAATTGNASWDVCTSGASNTDDRWAYSWSQHGTACESNKYIWRTQGVPNQCDDWCLNIAHGDASYGGSPNLEIRCTDWD